MLPQASYWRASGRTLLLIALLFAILLAATTGGAVLVEVFA